MEWIINCCDYQFVVNVFLYLCHAAEPSVGLWRPDLHDVEVVTALVVHGPGEAERATLLVDAEQIPRIHEQHVGQGLLLEGDRLNHCNSEWERHQKQLKCLIEKSKGRSNCSSEQQTSADSVILEEAAHFGGVLCREITDKNEEDRLDWYYEFLWPYKGLHLLTPHIWSTTAHSFAA